MHRSFIIREKIGALHTAGRTWQLRPVEAKLFARLPDNPRIEHLP